MRSVMLQSARLALLGISRRQAAGAVCLSYSAFTRKLREGRLTEEEWQAIEGLPGSRGGVSA